MTVPVLSTQDKTDINNIFNKLFDRIDTYIVQKTSPGMYDLKRVYFYFLNLSL